MLTNSTKLALHFRAILSSCHAYPSSTTLHVYAAQIHLNSGETKTKLRTPYRRVIFFRVFRNPCFANNEIIQVEMKIQFFLKRDISLFVLHLTTKTIKVSLNNSLKKKKR